MSQNGWIKLHRKIRDNTVFADPQLLRLWIICLTDASHKEHEVLVGRQVVKLQPGQFVTGRFELHNAFNQNLKKPNRVSEITVWRWLKTLEELDFLNINSNNKFSIVSVTKWSEYQFDDQQNDQQVINKRSANDQQMITNKNEENEENSIILSSTASKPESFYSAHQRVFGFGCNPLQAQKLAAYIDNDGIDESVVVRAIERAAEKGTSYRFGFITRILNDYADAGAKTVEAAVALDNEFSRRVSDEKYERSASGFKSRGNQAAGHDYEGPNSFEQQYPGVIVKL